MKENTKNESVVNIIETNNHIKKIVNLTIYFYRKNNLINFKNLCYIKYLE